MLATSAIAAALAISTPGVAQQVQPVPTNPAPTTTTTPTTTDAPPPVTDAPAVAPTEDTATPEATPSTAEAKPATTTAKRTSTASSAAAAAAAAARRAEAQSLARTLAARKAATAPAASPVPAAAVPAATPVAEPVAAEPAPAPKPAAQPASGIDERTLELGGGALALLALGGGALALMRRRRREDEMMVDDEVAYHDQPVEKPLELHDEATVAEAPAAMPRHDPATREPAFLAPPVSAFAWNAGPRHDAAQPSDDGDDRMPGESWVERAHRGPSASNPSLSLKKRLKRAAFFDQRERDVAEGTAVPVEADAGLPEALELENA